MPAADNMYYRGPATVEDAVREGQFSAENNFEPMAVPQAAPASSDMVAPIDWMYDEIPVPDYKTRMEESMQGLQDIKDDIINTPIPSSGTMYSQAGFINPVRSAYDPYNYDLPVSETHTRLNSGKWISKYPTYFRGIDNEDLYARQQSAGEKAWNGFKKFALKVGINVVGNLALLPDRFYTGIKEGTWKSLLHTDLDKVLEDWNTQLDYNLPNYYRREVSDWNFWQKLTGDTANFFWNDIMGNGAAFTVGAMATGFITGGLGLASLGNAGARLGLRAGVNAARRSAARAAGTAAGTAAREAAVKNVGNLKYLINNTVRKSVRSGRATGSAIGKGLTLGSTVGYEATVEANDFIKNSQEDFKRYYEETYGRRPTRKEMAEFTDSVKDAASAIFAANAAILSVSNVLLFGKFIGVGNKFIPKLEQGINKKLFGLGVKSEVKKPGEYIIKVSNQNLMQKIAAHTYNITKRPVSEGLWEEGLQGVVKNTADEYIKSRYDDVTMGRAKTFFEAVRDGFHEQYTSKEGWTEIGIGAFIGGFFGIGSGFGVMENSRNRKRYSDAVERYNTNNSNFNGAALKLLKQSLNIGTQLNVNVDTMSSREFDDAVYAKLQSADDVGMLDDEVAKFESFMGELSDQEIAQSAGISVDNVPAYKSSLITEFKRKVEDYRNAKQFAEDLVGDENRQEYRAYVSRNIYLGNQAEQRMEALAEAIEKVSSQEGMKNNMDAYSKLNEKMREKAKELAKIRSEVEGLQKEIADMASKPRVNKDGVDTAAKRIQDKTKRMNDLQNEYQAGIDQLNHMKNSVFDVNSFRQTREQIFSSPFTMMTGEDFVRAYEQLSSFDNYLSEETEKPTEQEKAKKQAIESLISEYRENLLNYRNTTNFIMKLNDRRAMEEDFRGFMKLLRLKFKKSYDMEREGETPYPVQSGTFAGKTDEELDNAFKEGKITEDELFSAKALMHSLDRLRTREQARNNTPITETISDQTYAQFMPDEARDADTVFGELQQEGNVFGQITDKLINIGESALSPREKDIYNANKQNFDEFVKRPKSVMDELRSLREKAEKMEKAASPMEFNNAVIDYVRSDTEQKDALNKAIDNYNKEAEKRDKGDSSYSEDNLNGAIDTINQIGLNSGVDGLADLVIHNYDMRSQKLGVDTRSEFGDKTDMKNITEPETPQSDTESGVDNMQNPVVIMARRIGVAGDGTGGSYEVSGLQLERMLSEGILKSRDGSPVAVNKVDENTYEVTAGGVTFTLMKSNFHNRWLVNANEVDAFNANTNMAIRDVGTGFAIVLRYDAAVNKYTPFYTNVGFGENEKDKIDQDALSKLKRGDDLRIIVDPNDTYNQKLLEEYDKSGHTAEDKKKLTNNLVIRVETMDGKLVSVVKANFGDVSERVKKVREKAFDLIQDPASRKRSEVILKKRKAKVLFVIPGHPNLLFNDDGSVRFESVSRDNGAMKRVAGVGYILNGEVHVKGKGGRKTDKFMMRPFVSSYINDSKGLYKNRRIPVIAVESQNGDVYLYPVRLKSTGSNPEVESAVLQLESILGRIKNGEDTVALLNRGFVSEVNRLLTTLGAPASVFQISYGPNTVTQIENVINEMKRRAGVPNVEAWMSDNADVEQIVADNVEVNINLAEEPFIAPILQVDLFTGTDTSEGEISEPENEPVQRPEVPAGTEVPFGETTPPEGTTEHADEANEEAGVEGVTTDTFEPITTSTVSKPVDLIRDSLRELGEQEVGLTERLSDPISHEDSGNLYNVSYKLKTSNGTEVDVIASLNNKNGEITYWVANKEFGNKTSFEFGKRAAAWNNMWSSMREKPNIKHPFEIIEYGTGISYAGFDNMTSLVEFVEYAYSTPFVENGVVPFNNRILYSVAEEGVVKEGLFGNPSEASEWLFGKLKDMASEGGVATVDESGNVTVSYRKGGKASKSLKEIRGIASEIGERYNISVLKDDSVLESPTKMTYNLSEVLERLTDKVPNNRKSKFSISVTDNRGLVTITMGRKQESPAVRDMSESRLAGKASTSEGASEAKKEC